ncbi:hypothetical protein Barb7_00790 [Bacteroidales bacterium Barb7]|nr:hypothetical protein Barb7_00790 [Bacteroidales bacterium Barb7]
MGYFSPTWSKAECGVMDDTVKKVLKGRYKMQHIIFDLVVLSELIGNCSFSPTFRYAPCGAEISCPFRASA